MLNTLGNILSRACRARLEFQPQYPLNITSAYVKSICDKLNSFSILMLHSQKIMYKCKLSVIFQNI